MNSKVVSLPCSGEGQERGDAVRGRRLRQPWHRRAGGLLHRHQPWALHRRAPEGGPAHREEDGRQLRRVHQGRGHREGPAQDHAGHAQGGRHLARLPDHLTRMQHTEEEDGLVVLYRNKLVRTFSFVCFVFPPPFPLGWWEVFSLRFSGPLRGGRKKRGIGAECFFFLPVILTGGVGGWRGKPHKPLRPPASACVSLQIPASPCRFLRVQHCQIY